MLGERIGLWVFWSKKLANGWYCKKNWSLVFFFFILKVEKWSNRWISLISIVSLYEYVTMLQYVLHFMLSSLDDFLTNLVFPTIYLSCIFLEIILLNCLLRSLFERIYILGNVEKINVMLPKVLQFVSFLYIFFEELWYFLIYTKKWCNFFKLKNFYI